MEKIEEPEKPVKPVKIELPGNCFLCGEELTKTKMRNHVLKHHLSGTSGETTMFIKAEGGYQKKYWLLLDVAFSGDLGDLDWFLREIWLECCDHCSGFRPASHKFDFGTYEMETEISELSKGLELLYSYDYGSTTELLISFLGYGVRPPQGEKVRLLARNVPLNDICVECGKPATVFCPDCYEDVNWVMKNAYYCKECGATHNPSHEYLQSITNSPRNGVCAYGGEQDRWKFDASKIQRIS
ncbi:MAG: hypothetical protein LBV52_02090 [Spirochaetaceae bacterium]|nr:hypothetical protein [Spirochaetaceae bacterium]